MKKLLFGTTAIVAAGMLGHAPASAAEKLSLNVGGYMQQWVGYASVDQDNSSRDIDGVDIKSDSEIWFTGSTTLDNGIEFGVNVQLEANSNSGDQIDESYLIVKGNFGEINLGSENSAMYKMHVAPTDYGIEINTGDQIDWAAVSGSGITTSGYFRAPYGSTFIEALPAANDSEKLTYYTPRFAGFQLGASYSPDTRQDNLNTPDRNAAVADMVTFGASYKGEFAGVKVAVSGGYGTFLESPSGTNEPEAYNFGGTIGYAGFEVGAAYAKLRDSGASDGEGLHIGASYTTGPLGVSLGYFDGDRNGTTTGGVTTGSAEQQTVHLSANYTLGPGVVASGTLGYANFDTNDRGVSEIEATYLVTGIKLSF